MPRSTLVGNGKWSLSAYCDVNNRLTGAQWAMPRSTLVGKGKWSLSAYCDVNNRLTGAQWAMPRSTLVGKGKWSLSAYCDVNNRLTGAQWAMPRSTLVGKGKWSLSAYCDVNNRLTGAQWAMVPQGMSSNVQNRVPAFNDVLGSDRGVDLSRERSPPHIPPIAFEKHVLRRLYNVTHRLRWQLCAPCTHRPKNIRCSRDIGWNTVGILLFVRSTISALLIACIHSLTLAITRTSLSVTCDQRSKAVGMNNKEGSQVGSKNQTLCSSESDGDSPLIFGGIMRQDAIRQRPQHVASPGRIKSFFERDEENHAVRPVVVVLQHPHCLHYLLASHNKFLTDCIDRDSKANATLGSEI
ncbi:hypothetical protein J6590_016045 [Homalodisca vitripennis]|nr:hypothetical protein J6590_016045 [Homalodisca vitripennis]